MPMFYFDFVHNGETNRDAVGQDLADEHVAQREAVRALAEIAAEEIPRDGKLVLAVTVADAGRRATFRALLTFDPTVPLE